MPTATSPACSRPTAASIRPSTAASPSPTTRRRPSPKAAAASASRPTARSLSAGYTNLGDALRNHVILIRLNADGTLDQSFGGFVYARNRRPMRSASPRRPALRCSTRSSPMAASPKLCRRKLSDGSYVTTGYGGATAEGTASTLGFQTTVAPDLVSFKVEGNALDTDLRQNGNAVDPVGRHGPDDGRRARPQRRRPAGRPPLHVGYFGGIAAAIVLDADGKLDTTVSDDGILALPNDTVRPSSSARRFRPTASTSR